MRRGLLLKAMVVVTLGVIELTSASRAEAQVSIGCSDYCMTGCRCFYMPNGCCTDDGCVRYYVECVGS